MSLCLEMSFIMLLILNTYSQVPLASLCRIGGWVASCPEVVLRLLLPICYRVEYFSRLEAFDPCGAFSHSWLLRANVL